MAPSGTDVPKEEMDMVRKLYKPTTKAEKLEAYSIVANIYDKIFKLQLSHKKLNQYFLSFAPEGPLRVFDAGCGTGYGAIDMHKVKGDREITMIGGDFSKHMLDKSAETGAYAELVEVDLNEKFIIPSGPVDGIVSAGVFMDNHVPPSAFVNLLEHLRPGGIAAITVREATYDNKKDEYLKWIKASNCEMLQDKKDDYFMEGPSLSAPVMGVYLVLQKLE